MKIGIDIGGSHVGIGIVDEYGNIVEKVEKYVVENGDSSQIRKSNLVQDLERFIIETLEQYKNKYEIDFIGIAVPGTVNDTTIIKAVNLGLENYEIATKVENELGIKVKLKNDAKCSALAEQKYGSLQGYSNGLFLCLGTGVGGAVIYNGKLLESQNVPGFEFSHMIIQKNGKLCNCGKRGCFETYASFKKFKEKLINEFNLESLENDYIKEFIRTNLTDIRLRYLINEYIENLAIGISNIINIFEPEVIVIGGGFADYNDILIEPLKKQILSSNLLFNPRSDIIIQPAKLKNDAGIIGATLI